MRTVLYTHDLIPITVLDLPAKAMRLIEERGYVRCEALEPMPLTVDESRRPYPPRLRVVTITAERFCRGRTEAWMLFTHDEESAMRLKAAFLPGQTGEVRAREQRAFAQGLLTAIGLG